MGAAAACALADSGVKAALIDQATLPNPRAASVDHSKVFRFAYPEPLYVRLAVDSLPLWRELESIAGEPLITSCGVILLARKTGQFEDQSYAAMSDVGVRVEMLNRNEVAARYPQLNTRSFKFAVFDPSGAVLNAERCVSALLDRARVRGVEMFEGLEITAIEPAASGVRALAETGERFYCDRLVVAAGPWTRRLLPGFARILTTTRQELAYFKPRPSALHLFEPQSFPIFLELDNGFYGFPVHHAGAMKIANHHKGPEIDPSADPSEVSLQFVDQCREFFSEVMPALFDAEAVETRVCIYNNTPDDDFVIDWHPDIPGVLIVTGFSGHGFKFGPLIGRIAADLLISGASRYDLASFALARFNR